MARLVAPATSPFHSVVSCGVSPSISDVKWLSKPQQTQASATSSPGRNPADCSSHDSSSAAATTSPAPTQARPVNWSRNSTTPSIGGGDQFQVEPQRHRRGGGQPQAQQQQHRPRHAAQHHGTGQPHLVGAVQAHDALQLPACESRTGSPRVPRPGRAAPPTGTGLTWSSSSLLSGVDAPNSSAETRASATQIAIGRYGITKAARNRRTALSGRGGRARRDRSPGSSCAWPRPRLPSGCRSHRPRRACRRRRDGTAGRR